MWFVLALNRSVPQTVVQFGPFKTYTAAEETAAFLEDKGLLDVTIVDDKEKDL